MVRSKKFRDLKILFILGIVIFIAWFSFVQPTNAGAILSGPFALPAAEEDISSFSDAQANPGPGVVLSFSPQADARIRFVYPDKNYGSTSSLNLDGETGVQENFLLKFDVMGLGGYPVEKATLLLYNVNHSDAGGDFYYVADNSWSETTVTWNNAPPVVPPPVYSLGDVIENTWYEVDLTSLITGDGVYSLRVSSTSTDGADYSSKEGLKPPELKITLGGGPTATPGPSPTPTITYTPSPTVPATTTFTPEPSATPRPDGQYRFAVIGDYGEANQEEADVAAMIKSYNPDFIITTGDNNYPDGAAGTIDQNIGRDYHEFIYPYTGSYGAGAMSNRFFPSLGNHDLHEIGGSGQPYYEYFTLPNNERYYDFVIGPLHFFILNSDSSEVDGYKSDSVQAKWLQSQLAASSSLWNIVYFHVAPYSSGANHGSSSSMQWPFKAWGADVVMSGHEHTYERLSVDGIPYFVNGVGGAGIYDFSTPLPQSQIRFNGDWGAMIVDGNATQLDFRFITRANLLVDSFTIYQDLPPTATNTSEPTVTPTDTVIFTPTVTETDVPIPTPTATDTSAPTGTATLIPTATETDTPDPTPTATNTSAPTGTATLIPTSTETDTPDPSPTATNTSAPTVTSTEIPTATETPVPTATNSPEPSPTITPSPTASPTPSYTPLPTPTSTPTAIPDSIFSDGFESGDLMNWSASATDAGDLSVTSAAALVGQSGMAVLIDDKRAIYVSDTSPEAESRYRARFYLDPNSIQMSSTALVIFYGYTGSSTQVLRIELRYSAESFQVRAGLRTDTSTWIYTTWTNINDASHYLELDWRSATNVGANDGGLTFWIDGVQAGSVAGIDNDRRRIDLVSLGALAGLGSTTRGTLYFDAFESRRQVYIGPAKP